MQDHTGAYSEIEYGKRGDGVQLISVSGNMALVQGSGEAYHIRVDKLSESPVELIAEPEWVKPKIEKPLNKQSRTSGKKNPVAVKHKTTLF